MTASDFAFAPLLGLLPHHRADLHQSGLSEATIQRWGCYSVEDDQRWVMTQLGFGHVEPPALALPIITPDRTAPNQNDVILKPDRPRIDARQRPIKYECRPRSRNRIHAPLSIRDKLNDPSEPLIITEGQKKAEKAGQEEFCCIALPGVDNWRDRIGESSFPIADIETIPVKGRLVLLAFDSDAASNSHVRRAERDLGAFLTKCGARVLIKHIPPAPAGKKQGLDDFLLNHSAEDFYLLPEEPINLKPDVVTLISELTPGNAKDRRRVLDLIAQETDRAERGRLLKIVAERTDAPLSDLRAVVSRLARTRKEAEARVTTGWEADNNTDLANAGRLVSRHGQDLRHSQQMGWLVWDGARWMKDTTREVERRGKETVVSIYREAVAATDEDDRQTLMRWAHQSQSESRIRAMLSLAKSELSVVVGANQLDANPWSLNCQNGTIDLRTGELLSHRRSDLITKLVPLDYNPRATCPRFLNFLAEIMDRNALLVEYLWRALGYALTGDTREQVLHLFYGIGANGKTTLVETLRNLLGNYSAQADFSTFLAKNHDTVRNDIARLAGIRFVTATEARAGRRLDEVLVKMVTGGDRILARYLFQEFFEFDPQFKLFLAANHKPNILGSDNAIWRRIRLIPFAVTIPAEKQDRDLKEKFRSEFPGILAWLVQGCLDWQLQGLKPPPEVLVATQDYRDEMDLLADFLAERCVSTPTAKAKAGDLYREYTAWSKERSEEPLSQKMLGVCLGERGFQRNKDGKGTRWWRGVGIKEG